MAADLEQQNEAPFEYYKRYVLRRSRRFGLLVFAFFSLQLLWTSSLIKVCFQSIRTARKQELNHKNSK